MSNKSFSLQNIDWGKVLTYLWVLARYQGPLGIGTEKAHGMYLRELYREDTPTFKSLQQKKTTVVEEYCGESIYATFDEKTCTVNLGFYDSMHGDGLGEKAVKLAKYEMENYTTTMYRVAMIRGGVKYYGPWTRNKDRLLTALFKADTLCRVIESGIPKRGEPIMEE